MTPIDTRNAFRRDGATGATTPGTGIGEPGVAPTMSKGNRTGTGTIGAAVGTTVRRLTPRECERLQGFPDDWTTGPDSRRYAALGDAVTVNVAQWIGRRIMEAT